MKRFLSSLWMRYALVIGIACLCVYNAHSLVTGEIGTMFTPRHISEDYYRYREFINAQEEYFRVLSIPVPSKWMVYTNSHPKVSMVDLVRGDWKAFSLPSLGGHPERSERKWLSPLEQSFSNRLLDMSAIRYVVVPRDDPENADDFFGAYGDRDVFLRHLRELPYLRLIDVGTGDVTVFENDNVRDHIYATHEEESLLRDVPAISLVYRMISPSEYHIDAHSLRKALNGNDGYVHFAERFDGNWKMYRGEVSWWQIIRGSVQEVAKNNHVQNEAGLQTFYISQEDVKGDDTVFTLFFRPQAFLIGGLFISGAVAILCVSILIFRFGKKYIL
jgi:hypothetical protein